MKISKSRARIAVVAAAAFLVGTPVAWWLLRPPPDPEAVVRRLWARRGVDAPNVVLVTLDTTRADHVGCYGYAPASTPTIDALARRGALFTQAASAAPLTLPAHSSI